MIRIPLAVLVAGLALAAGCHSDDNRRHADASMQPREGMYYDANGVYRDRNTETDARDYQRSARTSNFTQDDYFGDGDKPLQNNDTYATPRDTTYDPNYPDNVRDNYPPHPRDNR